MRKFSKILFIGMALLVCQIGIQAQTNGTLSGTVTDPQGAVVAGATVKATNSETGSARTATTNSQGVFQMSELNPGTYTVSVENKGFKKSVAPGVIVSVSKEAQLSITLEVGAIDQVVTVTSSQDVINTTSPNITSTVNTRQVVDLPLNGRNPIELAGLQAGIAVQGTDVRGSSVSGLRQTAVNLTQDGINSMDNFVKTSSMFALTTPSLNSTSEFSVTTGTVGSDAGRGGAQVNIVTKGGSNDYHGGAFGQIINNWTDANTWFNNFNGTPKPVLRQHYLGFDIGGPVHFLSFNEGGPKHWSGKDKAFFFFSYERFVQNDSRSRNRTVLTQSALNGTYQYTRTCPVAPNPIDPNCNNGVQTVNLLTAAGVPFNTKNPLLTAHLAQIPLPNNNSGCGGDGFNISCYTFNANQLTSNDKYVFRYDHQILKDSRVGSHKFEFVYSKVVTRTYPDVTTNGLEAPFPGGVNGFQASRRMLVTPAIISQFGSNITNTFRYGRQWAPVDFNLDVFPSKPFISLPGVLTNYDNTFLPQPRNAVVNQVTDNLSWVKGNHLFKFGMDWQNVLGISRNDAGIVQLIQLGVSTNNPSGLSTAATGQLPGATAAQLTAANTVYGAITGMLSSSSLTLNIQTPTSGFVPGYTRLRLVQGKDTAVFGQDQWRLASNFTLSYGVRYDYMGVPTVPNGLAIQPDSIAHMYGISGEGNLFKPTAAPGSQTVGVATLRFVSGDTGIPLYKDDWNNFAPFVGFAWSPNFKNGVLKAIFGGEGKGSIRAGYSISYLHDGVTTFTNLLGTGTTNPGIIATANLSQQSCPAANPGCTHTATLVGQLTGTGVQLDSPAYKVPITDRENNLLNVNNGLWTADPNLRTPYVHQWNFGIEREIFKDTAIEVRYVGNYSPNQWRAFNINEVNIFENGFLQDFKNAQINLVARGGTNFAPAGAAGAPACAACVATPIFDKFFTGLAFNSANGYQSAAFITALFAGDATRPATNNVGTIANTLAFSSTYRTNRESAAVGLAGNFFVANPNALNSIILKNDAYSNYNALEIEFRRRFASGLQFQLDYTWSKALGDAVDNQGNSQADLASHLTLRNTALDFRRSGQDQEGRFISNGVYELPVGKGRPFFSDANGFVDRVIGGWSVGAIVTWATGVPTSVTSGRTTFNSATGNNGAQLGSMTFEEFKKNVGVYKHASGLFFINPDLLNITTDANGRATSSTLKLGLLGAPAPGTFGNFPINELRGPAYFNFDLSVTKRIPITEKVRVEVKSTFINVLNYTNFVGGFGTFDSTSFGRITAIRGTQRQMNFIGQIRF